MVNLQQQKKEDKPQQMAVTKHFNFLARWIMKINYGSQVAHHFVATEIKFREPIQLHQQKSL